MLIMKLWDDHYKEVGEIRYDRGYQLEADSICHTESTLGALIAYAFEHGFTKVLTKANTRKILVMA